MSCKKLIHCIGLAIAEKGLKGLAGAVPFGAVVYDIAFSARERYLNVCIPGNELQEISFAANATPDQIKGQVAEVIEEIKKNAPPAIAGELKNPEIEQKLKSYLQQVPSAIRASMRRPSDPSGKSLSSGFSLGKGDAFVKFLPENLPKFKPGKSPVGNWKLVELLGVGGFGEVWKAEHPTLKGIPPVALKFCLSPESAKFIRHEGQLLSRIMGCSANNPGIVKLKQAYIDSEINCLEYEFVNGGDLCGLLADWLQLSKEKRIQVALQMLLNLARIIAPLHRMNPPIVHRDLKPANILIVKIDNKILLKVTDFGIGGFASKLQLDQNTKGFDQSNILTQTLRGSHTPLYASPEQQKGETPHPTDDVHALGVIGLQLLLCDLTIGPTGDWDVELKELGVDEKLIEILKNCLARQSRRFQDASTLAMELQKLIDEKPTPKQTAITTKHSTPVVANIQVVNNPQNNAICQNISKPLQKRQSQNKISIKKITLALAVSAILLSFGFLKFIIPSSPKGSPELPSPKDDSQNNNPVTKNDTSIENKGFKIKDKKPEEQHRTKTEANNHKKNNKKNPFSGATNTPSTSQKKETINVAKSIILEPFFVNNAGKKYELTIPENYSKVEVGFYQDSPTNITLNGAWNSLLTINENKIVAFKKDPVLNQMNTFVFENFTNNTTYNISNNYQKEQDVKLIDVTKQVKTGSNEVFFYHEQKKEMSMGLIFKLYTK